MCVWPRLHVLSELHLTPLCSYRLGSPRPLYEGSSLPPSTALPAAAMPVRHPASSKPCLRHAGTAWHALKPGKLAARVRLLCCHSFKGGRGHHLTSAWSSWPCAPSATAVGMRLTAASMWPCLHRLMMLSIGLSAPRQGSYWRGHPREGLGGGRLAAQVAAMGWGAATCVGHSFRVGSWMLACRACVLQQACA